MLKRNFNVIPNHIGILYKNSKILKVLEPGRHAIKDFQYKVELVMLPTYAQTRFVTDHRVLTKDNATFRFPFLFEFSLYNVMRFTDNFDVFQLHSDSIKEAQFILESLTKVYLRDKIAEMEGDEFILRNDKIIHGVPGELQEYAMALGLVIHHITPLEADSVERIEKLLESDDYNLCSIHNDGIDCNCKKTTAPQTNCSRAYKDKQGSFSSFLKSINGLTKRGKYKNLFGDNSKYLNMN